MRTHLNLTKAIFAIGLAGCFGIAQAQSSTPNQGTQSGSQSGAQTGTQSGQGSQGATGQRSGTGTEDHSQHTTGQSTSGQSSTGQSKTGRSNTSGDRSHSGASGTASGTTAGAAGSETMVGKQDHQFMVEAAQSNMMEIHMAQMAQQKASSDEVKQYAKQLEQDHTAASEKLKALAAQKNVQLPSEMGAKHQTQTSKFQGMSDAQFERAWLKSQVQHHKKDVTAFQRQVNRSMDSDVKEFAQNTLPKLQEHLQQAQQLTTSTGTRSRSNDRSMSSGQGSGTSNSQGSGSSTRQGTGTSDSHGTGRSDTQGTGTSNSQGTGTDANRTGGQNNPSNRK